MRGGRCGPGSPPCKTLGLFVKTGGYLRDVALMKAIDAGWIDGPRIVPADHAITPTGGHLDPTHPPSRTSLEGYPFHEMTEVFTYKAEINANWKLFIDAFAEFYRAPILHQKQAMKDEADKLARVGLEALHYQLARPHSMISSWGGMSPPKDLKMVKPIERVLKAGLFGPWDRPNIAGSTSCPRSQPGTTPGLGSGLLPLLPQLHAACLGAGLVPDLQLLAYRGRPAHLRDKPVLRAVEDRRGSAGP